MPTNLDTFVTAQAPVIAAVRRELAAGRKRTHWMWFVFPQLAGLGHSAMALQYGLAGVAEARAYLAHPVLGPRLLDLTGLVLAVPDRTALEIFGSPDDLKFRSCMTLFALADPAAQPFQRAVNRFFGTPDQRTLDMVRHTGARPSD